MFTCVVHVPDSKMVPASTTTAAGNNNAIECLLDCEWRECFAASNNRHQRHAQTVAEVAQLRRHQTKTSNHMTQMRRVSGKSLSNAVTRRRLRSNRITHYFNGTWKANLILTSLLTIERYAFVRRILRIKLHTLHFAHKFDFKRKKIFFVNEVHKCGNFDFDSCAANGM